jgi:hypothetical protein
MKRGQAATEYILVSSLILIIFIPATILFLVNIRNSNENLAISKLNKIGNDIVDNAVEVYYQGEPAKITLKESLPDGIVNMTLLKDWSVKPPVNQLVFLVSKKGKNNELVFDSDVNLGGSFTQDQITRGIKNIVLEATSTSSGIPYVNISIK